MQSCADRGEPHDAAPWFPTEQATTMSKGTSFFRQAGLSYLQYANKSANVLRETLKEPVKSKVLFRNKVEFAAFKWADGERGKRVDVDSIKKAAELFKSA